MLISVAPPDFDAWSELLDLLREAFATMAGRIDPPSSLDRMGIEEIRAKAKDEVLIVATAGTQLIGCAFADLRPDVVHVGKVAVADCARRKGVARALLAAAEEIARQTQRQYLELQTRVELTENHLSFAALGFEKVAETAHPGYSRATSITMRRHVPPRDA